MLRDSGPGGKFLRKSQGSRYDRSQEKIDKSTSPTRNNFDAKMVLRSSEVISVVDMHEDADS